MSNGESERSPQDSATNGIAIGAGVGMIIGAAFGAAGVGMVLGAALFEKISRPLRRLLP